MHSGFAALRNECGMNLHRPVGAKALSADARADIARIQEIWAECRERYGKTWAVSCSALSAARTPCMRRWCIASHLRDRGDARGAAYMDAMMALPAFQEWTRAGLAETLVIEKFEVE
jgi:glutathione S-transferase